MNDPYNFLMYERAGVVVLDPFGTLLALLLVVVTGFAISCSRLSPNLKRLVYVALTLRVAGALGRYVVLFAVYGGTGDARHYYSRGLTYAAALWQANPAPLLDPANWWGGQWWGTQFVYFPSSLVLAFTGASMPGAFIVFSLLAFAGLCGFSIAFSRTHPEIPAARYARWIWLFPALWFWPSSIGKEAIVLLGLGLAVAGYAGRHGRFNWALLGSGVFLIFAIRPQVAAVVILSLIIAHWLSLTTEQWTLRNTLQAVVLVAVGLTGIHWAMQYAGVESVDPDSVLEYVEGNKGRELGGGSAIGAARVGLGGVPTAFINILLRPFPWEARNPMVLITCVEIMAFWGIVWIRRRSFGNALHAWRRDRLLRLAVPFILIYSVSLGMVMSNMGVVARQRIFLFPFLFLLIEAVPGVKIKAGAVDARVRPVRRVIASAGSTA